MIQYLKRGIHVEDVVGFGFLGQRVCIGWHF